MRRRVGVGAVLIAGLLAGCGGGGGTSAGDLEKLILENDSHFQQADPLARASCAKGLGSDEGAEASCASVARSGAKFSVTVRRHGDGFAYDSIQTAMSQRGVEAFVREKHDSGTKADEFDTAKVACPGELAVKRGSHARCELTVKLGAVFDYDVAYTGDRLTLHLASGHWPPTALASAVLYAYNQGGKLKGARLTCPAELAFTRGVEERCALTLPGGQRRTMTVRMKDDEGTFNANY